MDNGGLTHTKEFERQAYGERIKDLLASDDRFQVGIAVRVLGGEYGATTKRPRRVGSLDAHHIKHAVDLNGVDRVLVTKADLLTDFAGTKAEGIPMTVGYELDGAKIDYVPTTDRTLRRATPIEEVYAPFTADISGVRRARDLPPELLGYLRAFRDQIGTRIAAVGVGPERDQMVVLNGEL
jgi:adenylosuccinate synthase